jgi:hypothetical protein
MGILDQVTQMKKQGASEEDIKGALREQNVSPRAINDAMDQSKIKEAVNKPGEEMDYYSSPGSSQQSAPKGPVTQEIPQSQQYQQPAQAYPPAVQNQQPAQAYPPAVQNQQPAQAYPPAVQNQQPANSPDYYEPQPEYYEPQSESYDEGGYDSGYQEDYGSEYGEGYGEEYYPQEGYGQDSYGSETDTMIEIAEQVFIEKMKNISEQLEDLNEFKTLAETKLANATNRLKRIEESIDHLQAAILEKVGSYGRGLDNIKKEMSMMQDSFSKTLPALAHRHAHSTTTHKPATKKTVSRRK